MHASLLEVKVLYTEVAPVNADIRVAGETDNRGNCYNAQRLACKKFPLVCFLSEIAREWQMRGRYLEVKGIPRQQDTEADALSNLVVRDSNPLCRSSSTSRIPSSIVDQK